MNIQDESPAAPINYHDDNRVLRYLLHTVKGIRPVSGGVIGEALEREYADMEAERLPSTDLDLEF
ncbi:MAG: hypothetical protein WAS27_01320 [Candidatus Saccharimonadales bacterium]